MDTDQQVLTATLIANMNKTNRDLLVLFNQELMTPQAIELEVEKLHVMLFNVERPDNLARAHEIIDLRKYKVISKPDATRKAMKMENQKPFVFINCRN